ncbi:hypothetical protein [Kutzneria buriramensis]|uniref:Uncharacterized protein n=1 Tax=Kutzneria buriramensis TaxID=1045776 RepID=A0A3E0HGJ7_9PSEU|nr:hypothetical protein [Kutzneria buriramensis]REH44803.1 hypothetical protein BCF44_108283 [Kutzneria buriramensis]
MAYEEKRAWIMLVVSVAAYAAYAVLVLSRSGPGPLTAAPYAATLLWITGGSIVATIVLNIAVSIASPRDSKRDQRDREIGRFGDRIGQSFVVVGGVLAMFLAIFRLDQFWIANAIYLAFTLSAVLGSVARIVGYRRGFQTW